ncbi:MAG: molybdopterin-guanine dinucleotide biosynthesis protein B [Dehalococcoidia bacterium]
MLPVICIVGKSSSGKTTLLERLVPELRKRGWRVAVAKHAPHGADLDTAGKDSWRLAQTGAEGVFLLASNAAFALHTLSPTLSLEDLANSLPPDLDVLLTEGFKESPFPKVETHRSALGPDLLCRPEQLAGVVSDTQPLPGVRTFSWEGVPTLADFLEATYLRPAQRGERVHLVVNGQPITLNPFAAAVMGRALLGMVSALKGIGKVHHLSFTLRLPPEG